MNNKIILGLTLLVLTISLSSCTDSNNQTNQQQATADKNLVKPDANKSNSELKYEKYELTNGLKVILHQDKSDPIVAMATIVHVGSNREVQGKTGFAHFFEHMSFNDSENVPKGSNRKLIPELGGTRNGGTWSDGTMYYEVVPKDAFDKLLWIDSDRLGFMINTVDQGTLEREKQVVKNEKRQRVDNRAYGHSGHVIRKALYPKTHPYNWTVIGDLEDLQSATLNDVREFYEKFYVPSNVTLVIAGDIDIEETKTKVERWFGEIKSGSKMPPIKPQAITLKDDIKLFHLDNFAKLPEIRITYPTIHQYHKEAYALDALGTLLSDGKNAVLYKVIVEQKKQAPSVSAYNRSEEVAGSFTIRVRGNAGVKLDDINTSIQDALSEFEKTGFTDNQLTKYKAETETAFYFNIESILNKALQMGIYNEYAGSPDFLNKDIENITTLTREDIMHVYKKYIKGKPAVITSFVPMDQQELVLTDSVKADVVEEIIKQNANEKFVENDEIKYDITPTKQDRSEPALTQLPTLKVPDVWQDSMPNGVKLLGIEKKEIPLVAFSLQITGGQMLDSMEKVGTASLMAELMNEGTADKTPMQLEEAIGLLGATLRVSASRDSITISGVALSKNLRATIDLMKEVLLFPRWDMAEFDRLKSKRLTLIKQGEGNVNRIAANTFKRKLYGDNHISSKAFAGNEETVSKINLDDVKAFYKNNISPKNANFQIVGAVDQKTVKDLIAVLNDWTGKKVSLPEMPIVNNVSMPKLYFIDLPGAKQSAIYVGKVTISGSNPDIYAIEFANRRLGGGMSARLAQTLRIQKGYTYGAYSYIEDSKLQSPFIASSQVRSNVTLESLQIFKDLIGNYQDTYFDKDLDVAKNMTIKGNSRRFETLRQLLGMLQTMSQFDLPSNYIEQQQDYVQKVTLEDVHNNIVKHLNEQQMIYLVVGDAETQLSRMKDLGYGEPIILDIHGNEVM
ncbi:MAG: insulinase family protein [Gammaproteobacteria bacterium]|nr:insulinase family protein [Gammaproteobacteria bacterium]